MSARNSFSNLGKATKNIQYPYLASVIVLVIQVFVNISILSYVSMAFTILYWIFIIKLSLLLRSMVMNNSSKSFVVAWKWVFLAAIVGIATILVGQLLTVTPYLNAMQSILNNELDSALLLSDLRPYMIVIMDILLIYIPAQFMLPAIFSHVGWKRVEKHVLEIDDVRKHAVLDAMRKLFISFSANFITGLCLAVMFVGIIGLFEYIGTSAVLAMGIIILISGIIAIIAAIVVFFCTVLGYNGTGEALKLIEVGTTVESNGVPGDIGKVKRCKSCGNPIPEDLGVVYCPICGVFIDDATRKAPDD